MKRPVGITLLALLIFAGAAICAIVAVFALVGGALVANMINNPVLGKFALGGEQSGHVIMLEHAATGDGMLTSLQLLAAVNRRGMPMAVAAKMGGRSWESTPFALRASTRSPAMVCGPCGVGAA